VRPRNDRCRAIPTTMTSRKFNQDASRAKKAAEDGPVFITDRGQPAHVLLSIEEYRRLGGGSLSLADAVGQPDGTDFEFAPARLRDICKDTDLS